MVIQIVDFAGFLLILKTEIVGTFVCIFVGNMLILFAVEVYYEWDHIIGISRRERQKQRMAWHLSVPSHQLFLLFKRHVGDLVPSILLLLRH